jgi:uncharacterized membrane protein YhhN
MLTALHQMFNSWSWKAIVVIILSLLATFAHELDVLKDGVVVYIVLIVLMLLIYTKEDLGFVVLLSAVFILSYNNVIHKTLHGTNKPNT